MHNKFAAHIFEETFKTTQNTPLAHTRARKPDTHTHSRLQDAFAVRIFEEIVRFHILSEHELCAEDQSGEMDACMHE